MSDGSHPETLQRTCPECGGGPIVAEPWNDDHPGAECRYCGHTAPVGEFSEKAGAETTTIAELIGVPSADEFADTWSRIRKRCRSASASLDTEREEPDE